MTLIQKIRLSVTTAAIAGTVAVLLLPAATHADPAADPVLTLSKCQAQQNNPALDANARQVAAGCVQILTVPEPTPSPSSSPTPSASPTPAPSSSAPTPTLTSTGPGQWQDAIYGIPAGTVVTSYTIPNCTISTPTTLDAKSVSGCGTIFIKSNVTITRSRINGQLIADNNSNWSITVDRSFIDAGTIMGAALSNTNVHVTNTEIRGGAASVQCSGHCYAKDNWLHGQYAPVGAGWHDDGFITNGATDIILIHNRIVCDEGHGACTGDVFLAADFTRVTNVTVDHNLLMADLNVQFCAWGGDSRRGADHIVYTNNIFQRGSNGKCGKYGPYDQVSKTAPGNIWSGNVWDDGQPLN